MNYKKLPVGSVVNHANVPWVSYRRSEAGWHCATRKAPHDFTDEPVDGERFCVDLGKSRDVTLVLRGDGPVPLSKKDKRIAELEGQVIGLTNRVETLSAELEQTKFEALERIAELETANAELNRILAEERAAVLAAKAPVEVWKDGDVAWNTVYEKPDLTGLRVARNGKWLGINGQHHYPTLNAGDFDGPDPGEYVRVV